MLQQPQLQEAVRIAGMLTAINEKHAIAETQRPPEPDGSPEAKLFSAYDAAEAALGRMQEITPAGPPRITPAEPLEHPNPERMARELEEAAEAAESLISQVPDDTRSDERDHLESALGWIIDAGNYLSGAAHPTDNPAPYDNDC